MHSPGRSVCADHHVHRQGLAVALANEPGVVAQRGELVAAGGLQRVLQDVRLGETLGKIRALDRAARAAESVFERRVGKENRAVACDHRHQRGQQVERLEAGGKGRRLGQALILTTRPSSRLMPAMSLSLRAMLAFSSATRSRYFW